MSVTLNATAVKGTAEAILDSSLLLQATQAGVRRARAMKSGAGAFDVDDFVGRLITFMGDRTAEAALPEDSESEAEDEEYSGGPLDWERVGRRALAHSHRVATMDFMYVARFMRSMRHNVFIRLGPLSLEQKKRAVVKRAKLEKDKRDEKKPQQLTEDDVTRSENETTKNVATVRILAVHLLTSARRNHSWRKYLRISRVQSTSSNSSSTQMTLASRWKTCSTSLFSSGTGNVHWRPKRASP